MLLLVLAFIANNLALLFHKGQTFSYQYTSNVQTSADAGDNSSSAELAVTLNATFTVVSSTTLGAYMKLTISDLNIDAKDPEEEPSVDEEEYQNRINEICENPLYFKYKKDGSITDVIASKNDDEETVNLKLAVAYSLRTNLLTDSSGLLSQESVIDPLGQHTEFSIESSRGNSRAIETFYTEEEFDHFSDENLSKNEVSIECQTQHIVDNTRIIRAVSKTRFVLNKRSLKKEEEDIPVTYTGSSTLTDYADLPDVDIINDEITSLPKFLKENKDLALVAKLRQSKNVVAPKDLEAEGLGAPGGSPPSPYVPTSQTQTTESTEGCPAACTFCRGLSASKSLGNSNIGLDLYASAVIGVEAGCQSAKRNYIVGAYANIDVKVLGKTFSAVKGTAEYGQVDGVKKSNQISLSLFGKSLYSKTFTGLDCMEKAQDLFEKSADASSSITFPVFCVLVTLKIGVEVQFKASIVYQLCPNEFNASITLVPAVTVGVFGSCRASIIVASATLKLSGSVTDSVEPSVYVDGNQCRIGFKVVNHFHGITANLSYKYRVLLWGSSWHSIWSHTWNERKDTLYDKYFS